MNKHNASAVLDLRGERCPMTFVRARLLLERMPAGAEGTLRLADDGEAADRLPRTLSEEGHDVLSLRREKGAFVLRFRKNKSPTAGDA